MGEGRGEDARRTSSSTDRCRISIRSRGTCGNSPYSLTDRYRTDVSPCQARRTTAYHFVLARRWGTVVSARRGRCMGCCSTPPAGRCAPPPRKRRASACCNRPCFHPTTSNRRAWLAPRLQRARPPVSFPSVTTTAAGAARYLDLSPPWSSSRPGDQGASGQLWHGLAARSMRTPQPVPVHH